MCTNCNKNNCDCIISQNPINCNPCTKTKYCLEKMDTDCVFYHLDDQSELSKLICTGIPSNTSLTTILEEFDKRLCGFIGTFGIIEEDTDTIDLTVSTVNNIYTIKADVKISSDTCNALVNGSDGALFVQHKNYVSDSNTISITPSISGLCGEYSLDISCNTCVQFSPAFKHLQSGSYYITIDTLGIPASILSLDYEFTVNGIIAGQGNIPGVSNIYKLPSSIEIKTNDLVYLRFRSNCNYGCVGTWTNFYGTSTTVVGIPPDPCDIDWTDIPSGSILNGWNAGIAVGTPSIGYINAGVPQYKIKNKILELRGVVLKNPDVNLDLGITFVNNGNIRTGYGIQGVIDLTTLSACITSINTDNHNFGMKDTYTELHGNYTYNPAFPSERAINTINIFLTNSSSILSASSYVRTQTFDDSENAISSFPSVLLSRHLYMSLDGISIPIN